MTIWMRKLVKKKERKKNHLKIVYSPNKKMKQTNKQKQCVTYLFCTNCALMNKSRATRLFFLNLILILAIKI